MLKNSEKIVLNIQSKDIMSTLLHYTKVEDNALDEYFNRDSLLCVNKALKEGNYYAFDKYGLIIRRKEQNNAKSVFGWIYNENKEPISIHIDKILIQTNKSKNEIAKLTFQSLCNKFPSEFNKPKGIYKRVAQNYDLYYMK